MSNASASEHGRCGQSSAIGRGFAASDGGAVLQTTALARSFTQGGETIEVLRQLALRGGEIRYCDPWVDQFELDGELHQSVDWSAKEARAADCVVLLTPHRQFLQTACWDQARLIVDTRNVVPAAANVRSI